MRKVDLLVLTTSFPAGSGEGFLEEELRTLAERGIQLLVVPLHPRGVIRQGVNLGPLDIRYQIERLLAVPVIGAAILEFTFSPFRTLCWGWRLFTLGRLPQRLKNLAALPKALWLARILRASDVGHLHVHWASVTATCGMVAADLANVPWSFTCHRWDIYEDNLLALKGQRASFIRFISTQGRSDGCSKGVPQDKAIVIHMGVRLCLRHAQPQPALSNPLRIICAANLIPVKGHSHLFQAIALLHRSGIPTVLTLAGTGPLEPELRELASVLGIEKDIIFLGQLPHSGLLALYQRSEFDVFVLPSVDLGDGEHEGVPVSLMEAMAHGLLVVSTATGSIEELLPSDMQATVVGGDPEALAKRLELIVLDPEFRLMLAKRQAEIIGNWSCDTVVDELWQNIKIRTTKNK